MLGMRRQVRRVRWLGWPVPAAVLALLVLAAALGLVSTPAPVHAQSGGFPLPAPAGSVWSVVAGYNTGSHFGDDPHALDLVRDDAPAAGTPVLAPITGTITYVSSDCLTINNGDGMAVLLCHLFPDPALFRGFPVQTGNALGAVAPDFFAGNGGLAHLHLSVHRTLGAGQIRDTVPLVGEWALEGVDLLWTGAYNAHAGTRFVSSNGVRVAAPPPPPPAAPEPPSPDPDIDESFNLQVLRPGWNAVGWTARTSVAEVATSLGDAVTALFTFDRDAQRFRRFSLGTPDVLNDLALLRNGDGLLIHVAASQGAILARPPPGDPEPLSLATGFNLVTWTGEPRSIQQAVIGLGDALDAVFAWDAVAQRYQAFRPGAEPFLSRLTTLDRGQAVWVLLRRPAVWDPQASAPPAFPPDPPPPADQDPGEASGPGTPEGFEYRVVGPSCLNLRPAPTTIGTTPITCLAGGTVLQPLGPTATDVSGRDWMRVRVLGLEGWVATEFVALLPITPGLVQGVATFYHPSLAGNPMFCGGVYNPNDLTIASSTAYPCGTQLRLWRDGRSIVVTVQDTGLLPLNHIDLSEAAYNQLDLPAEGIIPIQIEVLSRPQ